MVTAAFDMSVCVATRGEVARLAPFLDGLRALNSKRNWELVLVHNAPHPPPEAEILAHARGLSLRLLHEPVPGKSRALNRAMAAARGDLLVFTDDDVRHPADWLDRLADVASSRSDASVIGGRIVPEGEVPAWVRRSANLQGLLVCQQDLGSQLRPYPPGIYPFGPNFAVRRSRVEAAGARWPEDLGPGTGLPVGDEYGFLAKISAPDATDRVYTPDAIVYHQVQPQYLRLPGALRRSFQSGLAAGRLHRRFGPARGSQPLARARDRIAGLRGPGELACVLTRAFGVACGRYLAPGRG